MVKNGTINATPINSNNDIKRTNACKEKKTLLLERGMVPKISFITFIITKLNLKNNLIFLKRHH